MVGGIVRCLIAGQRRLGVEGRFVLGIWCPLVEEVVFVMDNLNMYVLYFLYEVFVLEEVFGLS